MNAAELSDLARTLFKRAITADFQRERASDAERAELAEAPGPIVDPLAQDYVAWRRAALWVAAVLLSIGVLFAIADHSSTAAQFVDSEGQQLTDAQRDRKIAEYERGLGEANLEILDGLQIFLLLVKIAVASLALTAALRWKRVGSSRTAARWAWLVALLLPLVISGWPWGQALDFSHLERTGWTAPGQAAQLKQGLSVAMAALLVSTVAPKLIALFPGIMRSSLTLKTLLPQAAAPGWLTVVFAPFLVGFLLLILCFLSQVQGSWVLIVGVLLLTVGPCIYVKRAQDLVRPHTTEEVGDVVVGLRRQVMAFNAIGTLMLVFYLFGLDDLSWSTALHLLLESGGGIMLTMVVISDLTVALLAFSHRQGAEFHESELRYSYEQRLNALSTAGLTDLDPSLGMPAKLQEDGETPS